MQGNWGEFSGKGGIRFVLDPKTVFAYMKLSNNKQMTTHRHNKRNPSFGVPKVSFGLCNYIELLT